MSKALAVHFVVWWVAGPATWCHQAAKRSCDYRQHVASTAKSASSRIFSLIACIYAAERQIGRWKGFVLDEVTPS